jgi:glycosyltransferase involved in cell wall biosynthesis
MKRVLMLCYEFPPLGGGAGNAVAHLMREFSKDPDISIDLVTSSSGAYEEAALSDRIRIFRLDIGKRGSAHRQSLIDIARYSIKALSFSRKLCREKGHRLVHAFFGVPCGAIALVLGLPYLVSLRGSDVPGFNRRFKMLESIFLRRLSRHIWKKADRVVANSNALKELAQNTWPGEIGVVGNGVDTGKFFPKDSPPRPFTVLSASRLDARKGIDILVRAVGELSSADFPVRLVIAGGGAEESALRSLAAAYPKASVEFRGPIAHEGMPDLYAEADAFALVSEHEGMSNSLLEAMACGLAVISSEAGDARDIVGPAGVIVGRDPSSVSDALRTLAQDRRLLARMKSEARARSLSHGWDAAAKAYARIYSDIIGA